jgi:FAD/FMN-containing dehydrogenase
MLDLSAMRLGAGRSRRPARARRTGRAARRLRPRDAGLRTLDPDRHQLDHRHGRAHARRRLRLAEPQARPDHRQPGRRSTRCSRPASSHRRDAERNSDLFWALRGGGGNFGIVTSFEYRLHPLGPEVLAGLVVYPFDQAHAVFEGYRRFTADAPQEMTAWLVLRQAPPLPFLPPAMHGKEVVIVAFCWIGEIERGNELAARLRSFGKPAGEQIGPMPFAAWQTAFDPLLAPGAPQLLEIARLQGPERRRRAHRLRRDPAPAERRVRERSSATSAAPSTGCRPARPPIRIVTSSS